MVALVAWASVLSLGRPGFIPATSALKLALAVPVQCLLTDTQSLFWLILSRNTAGARSGGFAATHRNTVNHPQRDTTRPSPIDKLGVTGSSPSAAHSLDVKLTTKVRAKRHNVLFPSLRVRTAD